MGSDPFWSRIGLLHYRILFPCGCLFRLQAPMLSASEGDHNTPRKPFDFISNIFKRRRDHETEDQTRPPDLTLQEGEDGGGCAWESGAVLSHHDPARHQVTLSSEALAGLISPAIMTSTELVTSPGEVGASVSGLIHHTPVKSRDIGIDIEAIRLSRQDNPYLQRVADSHTALNDDETTPCGSAGDHEDRTHLVTQESQEGVLSLSEVHEHLIRSPPPTTLPKTLAKNLFVFPVAAKNPEATPTQGETATPARSGSLKPLVSRQHEDVLDHHLRQILHTQRQLVVCRPRPSEGAAAGTTSTSMPGSPAHARTLARRSPHARTLSEEATVVQSVGSVGGGSGSLAPVFPPGRRQHTSSSDLLNPTHPPTVTTPTPPILKPISSKSKRNTGGPETNLTTTSLRLPIRCPHQPAASSALVDIT